MGLEKSLHVLLCILKIMRTVILLSFSPTSISYWALECVTILLLLLYPEHPREAISWVRRWATFGGYLLLWFFVSHLAFPTPVLSPQQLFPFPPWSWENMQIWIWSLLLWPTVWLWANHQVSVCSSVIMALKSCLMGFLVFRNICIILQYLVHLNCSINVSWDYSFPIVQGHVK